MYRVTFQGSLDDPWRFMDSIRVGPVPTRGPEPHYITVERDGLPVARIDAYADHRGPFTELITWGRFVVLGWDAVVHLIDPLTRQVLDVHCNGYFGHLYPLADRLLIGTASELTCLDDRGAILWRRPDLGIDGVIVDSTGEGVIRGQGEWDPPGGWQPFRVSLDDGTLLEGGDPQRANPSVQRNGAAGIVAAIRKLLGRGGGR